MIEVQVVYAHPRGRVPGAKTTKYVRGVLQGEKIRDARISIVFIGSRKSRILNRTFLHHDYVTDVLSFTLESGKYLEGEIYVNLDRARSQAREYKVRYANEIARLIIHGVLHLAGYDDTTAQQKKVMRRQEETYLRRWFRNSQGKSV